MAKIDVTELDIFYISYDEVIWTFLSLDPPSSFVDSFTKQVGFISEVDMSPWFVHDPKV